MRIRFVTKIELPEATQCYAELIFEEGPLANIKLVGFGLWHNRDGSFYVVLPHSLDADTEFPDLLRSDRSCDEDVDRLKAWIVEQYLKQDKAP